MAERGQPRGAVPTTTAPDTEWRPHAQRLAELLTERGDLSDPGWAAAIAAIPRHSLVPQFFEQDRNGDWSHHTAARELELVYSPTTLVTDVRDGIGVSSSTKPDLMVRMLETLQVQPGHRVLEIGTGTGYNAALLSHRLGQDAVYSIDIDPALVDLARQRLAQIGYRPHLTAGDGTTGWPAHAPYDRILATCAVREIPWNWARQLTHEGMLLADLKIGPGAGNLVLLRRHADRLEGRFTARWAAFMTSRRRVLDTLGRPAPAPRAGEARSRPTHAPGAPWTSHREVWMLAARALPAAVVYGYRLDPETRIPRAGVLTAPDGSWCEIELAPTDGTPILRAAGPTSLGEPLEQAYSWWHDHGRPTWERLGLTVTPHASTLWLDDPEHPVPEMT